MLFVYGYRDKGLKAQVFAYICAPGADIDILLSIGACKQLGTLRQTERLKFGGWHSCFDRARCACRGEAVGEF